LRIRITRAQSGDIDGIDIGSLRPGMIYDLPASLATYLILNAAGEPAELRAADEDGEERIAVNIQSWREIAAAESGFLSRHRSGVRKDDGQED
jgi:hypothetical protein